MKPLIASLSVLIFSVSAFGSVTCENKLNAQFQKLKINTNEMRDSTDYLNPSMVALGKKAHDSSSMEELTATIKLAEKYEVKDSRKNEIIRVCTAIKTFADLGLSNKEIWLKTIEYQNGWSTSMTAPLEGLIQNEIDSIRASKGNIAMGLGAPNFCAPDSGETECQTPDGRVYKLNKAVNQLGRSFIKTKDTTDDTAGTAKSAVVPK